MLSSQIFVPRIHIEKILKIMRIIILVFLLLCFEVCAVEKNSYLNFIDDDQQEMFGNVMYSVGIPVYHQLHYNYHSGCLYIHIYRADTVQKITLY